MISCFTTADLFPSVISAFFYHRLINNKPFIIADSMFRPFNVIAIVYAAKIRPLSEFHPTSPFSKTETGEGHDDSITDDVRYEQKSFYI